MAGSPSVSRALALLVTLAVPALSSASARAAAIVFEVGVRAGYVFGRGWTVGPGLSVVRGDGSQLFQDRHVALLAGLAVSGDLVIGGAGELSYRLHVGPELGAVDDCPSLASTLVAGGVWVFRRGAPVKPGLEVGLSLLGAATDPFGGSSQLTANPLFVGLGYRFAGLLDGERDHELGLDLRLWSVPFETGPQFYLCGIFGGAPSRPVRVDIAPATPLP